MIAMISVRQTADKPNFPLRPLAVFAGSSMTLGVVDVPPTREGIAVTGVSLAVENAVGEVVSAAAVESGGVWTATIPASHFAAVGVVAMGVTISASGTDENGAARSWIVGKGDLTILPADGVPVPGETLQNVHLRDNVPETPAKGDLCEGASGWQIYTGDAWAVIAAVPSPSTSAPLMDGTANAGSSADYARGDHRHPTDTSRASERAVLLGQRQSDANEWHYGNLVASAPDWVWTFEPPEYSNGVWTTEITTGPDFETLTAHGGEDATFLEFSTASGAAVTASGTAFRSGEGYVLGSQSNKPLASEAEAEALRQGKQDALTFDNAPTAGSNNPVKSGGIWSAIWGALAALPTGFSSLYDWCVNQLAGKLGNSGDQTITSGAQAIGFGFDAMDPWIKFTDGNGNTVYLFSPQASGVAATTADLRYSFNAATVGTGTTPTVTNVLDRAINMATLGSSVTAATVTLPAATAGRARDFFVDLTIEATTAPTLTFIDPATGTTINVAFGADSLADIDTGKNAVLFTEFPNHTWLVSVKHEEVAA